MENTKKPILIADAVRGIYTTKFAAQVMEGMIRRQELRYNGYTVKLSSIVDAGSYRPNEEAESEAQAAAWDEVAHGIYYVNDTEHRIHEDEHGIFLIPEGYEPE
jgi:hypothetical protein